MRVEQVLWEQTSFQTCLQRRQHGLDQIWFVDELMTELPSADIMKSNSEHGSRSRLMAWDTSVGFYTLLIEALVPEDCGDIHRR